MAKTAGLGFRINESTKQALAKAAEDDDRSISSMVERILIAWLKEHGYLPREES